MPRNTNPLLQNIGRGASYNGFAPATFQAAVFTPEKEDMSLLQRSLATLDERKEKTDQQRAAIREALGKVKLNAAEDKWKFNYTNDIINKINAAAQYGDYGAALETATRLAGEISSSPELLGRIRANEQYEKEVQTQQARRDRGDISQATYKWWMKNNPYKYQDNYDNNGNIIGGSIYEPTFRPVNDINWASTAMAAFKMITPFKNSVSRDGGSNVTNNTSAPITRGNTTYKPGEAIGSTGHSSSSQEKVTKEQITARMEELLSSTADGYKQAEQAYDVAADEFKDLVEQYNTVVAENPDSEEAKILGQKIDARKKLMYRNGSKIDYKEYYARMITDSLFADGLAYDWRTSSSGGTSSYSISEPSRGGRGGRAVSDSYFPGATYNYEGGYWEGANVRQKVDTETANNEVTTSSSNISNRFKK